MLGKVLRLKNSKSLSVQKIAFLKLRKNENFSLKKKQGITSHLFLRLGCAKCIVGCL